MGHTYSTAESDQSEIKSTIMEGCVITTTVYQVQAATKLLVIDARLQSICFVSEDCEENCVKHERKNILYEEAIPMLAISVYTSPATRRIVNCFTVLICTPIVIHESEMDFPVISRASAVQSCTNNYHRSNRECVVYKAQKAIFLPKRFSASYCNQASSVDNDNEIISNCLILRPKNIFMDSVNYAKQKSQSINSATIISCDNRICNVKPEYDAEEKYKINLGQKPLNICSIQDLSTDLLKRSPAQRFVWGCIASVVISDELVSCKKKRHRIHHQPLVCKEKLILLNSQCNRVKLFVQQEPHFSKAFSCIPTLNYERCLISSCHPMSWTCSTLSKQTIAATQIINIKLKRAPLISSEQQLEMNEFHKRLPSSVVEPDFCNCVIFSGLTPLQTYPITTRKSYAAVSYIEGRSVQKAQVYQLSYPLRASIFVDQEEYCVCRHPKALVMSTTLPRAAKTNVAATVLFCHPIYHCISTYFVSYHKCKIVYVSPQSEHVISSKFTPLSVACIFNKLRKSCPNKYCYKPSRIPVRRERLRSS